MLGFRRFIQPHVLRYIRRIATSGRLASEDLMVHRDSPDNNEETPFKFTSANKTRLEELIKIYPEGYERSAISGALDLVQRQIGWIPISAMHKVAEILKIPRMRVYEWVTFYTMCNRRPRGLYHVKICKTTPCMLRGSDEILRCVEELTNCRVGGLSKDCLFGVDTVECQGACVNAPVVVVNDDYFEDLTLDVVRDLINALKEGAIPRPGPQSGRCAAEPICGLTTLLCPPPEPGFKVLAELTEDK